MPKTTKPKVAAKAPDDPLHVLQTARVELGDWLRDLEKRTSVLEGVRFDFDSRLCELEDRVEALVAQLAEEVRTQRLVVVEPDGFERVTIDSDSLFGKGVHVFARSDDDRPSNANLIAHDSDGDGAEWIELDFWGGGNGLAEIGIRRVEDDDGRPVLDRLGNMQFETQLHLGQPNSACGVVLDSDGLRAHPMRKDLEDTYREQEIDDALASRAVRARVAAK